MIEKSPVDKQKFIKNLLFTSNARAAWEHILYSLKSTKDVEVLMPSYIGYTDREGSGVFDPVQKQNAYAEFYKLNEDLTIDINHFKELLKNKKFDCALIIHYFGFCRNNMEEIKNICQENNVVLIEDCAHAFHLHNKDSLLGNYGDFSFYSLHKYLPTNSGGVLKKNNDNSVLKSLEAEKKIDIQDLEHYANSDYNEIAKKRRNNYLFYKKYIDKHSDVQVIYELMPNDIPQTFPILIKNNQREKLYFYLMDQGAPTTALYYRLIDQIKKEDFPVSHKISQEILNLPVHQDTNQDDIIIICDLIRNFFTTKD